MRIDLFELLEGTLRGIVYFFYNLIETVARVVTRPWQGPLLLHRRYKSAKERQIGGLTTLFIGFLVFLALLAPMGEASFAGLASRARTVLDSPPEMNPRALWPYIAGSLVCTLLVDSALRLWLRLRLPRLPRRRELVLSATEYALLLPIIIFIVGAVVLAFLARYLRQDAEGNLIAVVIGSMTAAAIIGSLAPAARILALSQRCVVRERSLGSGEAPDLDEAVGPGIRAAAHAALLVLILSAGWGGVAVANEGREVRTRASAKGPSAQYVTEIRCDIRRSSVQALLVNSSDHPLIIDPEQELVLMIGTLDSERGYGDGKFFMLSNAPAILLRPGESELIVGGIKPSYPDYDKAISAEDRARLRSLEERVRIGMPVIIPVRLRKAMDDHARRARRFDKLIGKQCFLVPRGEAWEALYLTPHSENRPYPGTSTIRTSTFVAGRVTGY